MYKNFANYLNEMSELPALTQKKYGKYAELTKANRAKRKIDYITTHYNDKDGSLWLNVKQKDYYTIALAVLSGMIDTHAIEDVTLKDLDSNEAVDNYLKINREARDLVQCEWNFLKKYMSKGYTTVYRGLSFTIFDIINLYHKDKKIFYNPERIIPLMDNTTKEFNSYSTSKHIAMDFAHVNNTSHIEGDEDDETDLTANTNFYVVMSAEVENNDVNWAFTAYLVGRHRTVAEDELNINNMKTLKNVKVIMSNLLPNKLFFKMNTKLWDNNVYACVFKHVGYDVFAAICPDETARYTQYTLVDKDGNKLTNKRFNKLIMKSYRCELSNYVLCEGEYDYYIFDLKRKRFVEDERCNRVNETPMMNLFVVSYFHAGQNILNTDTGKFLFDRRYPEIEVDDVNNVILCYDKDYDVEQEIPFQSFNKKFVKIIG